MPISRRDVLGLSGAAALAAAGGVPPAAAQDAAAAEDWEAVRGLFALSGDKVHMSAMLIASHPAPVRAAIEEHRRALDADPVEYLEANNARLGRAAREAAGRYLGVHPSHVALTDSTTMGVGLVYGGLRLREGDEVLTSSHDYYVTHESLRLAARRTGASLRRIDLYDDIEAVSEDEIVGRIVRAVGPRTRLLALTWVHSSTGLKLPAAAIAAALRDVNAGRDEADQVLFGLDGVHGFGVEDAGFAELGCDFLMAGCHKWLFGPRGTGIVAIGSKGLDAVAPTIPSFTDDGAFAAWIEGRDDGGGRNHGGRMSPGGFKPFEHLWALPAAFELHERIGRGRIAARTHALATALKRALAEVPGVSVRTPRDERLSAGIVSFDVGGRSPADVVAGMRARRIIGSVAPYAVPHVRLTPSIRNSEAEIARAADALREIA